MRGNRRKHINVIITMAVSGLWHGAQWSYVAWGLLNGLYQVTGDILKPAREFFIYLFRLNKESLGHQILRIVTTFVLIDISWIFFRAKRFKDAVVIIKSIMEVYNPWIIFDGSLYKCGLDQKNFNLMLICIVILLITDIFKYNKVVIREIIAKQDWWCQSLIIAFAVLAILLFGIWGSSYNAANFIYFQF